MPFMYLQTSHMAEKSNAINTPRISLNFIIYIYNISDVREKKKKFSFRPRQVIVDLPFFCYKEESFFCWY